MPFGLCNAPSAFQHVMGLAFSDLLHKSMIVYIDDFSTQSNREDHLPLVEECLIRCCKTGIALNPDKLFLGVKKGILLCYVVSKEGKQADPEKVEVIVNLPAPKDVKGVQRVLGHTGYYRKLIEDFTTHAQPLTNLIKKSIKFEWTPLCQ